MIDIEKLRNDLINHFYGIAFTISPVAFMDVTEVQEASDERLIEIAISEGFNLEDYKVKTRKI